MSQRKAEPWVRRLTTGLLLLVVAPLFGQQPPAADRWEKAMQAFEAQDKKQAPPQGANLFVGSSSIRLWKLDKSFPDLQCINRGFGGSEMADSVRYAGRIVLPHKPKVIVVYAGDNDIAAGKAPEKIRDDYLAFVKRVRASLPDVKIVYIAIKPSPRRWALAEKGAEANRLIAAEMEGKPNQVFLDIWKPMLGSDGKPREELFVEDKLHMSPAGYEIWSKLLRPHLVTK